ncbi:hypothetical protein DM860_011694 [Cuscuta australis]|uniref:Uncharacterized protein n=1 Tax=Cuscuta australis TaxID=267555 RepID=A0A328DF99_9ASTE|nr:hypothetical protein DM860_011694 [Cuscuta australis]
MDLTIDKLTRTVRQNPTLTIPNYPPGIISQTIQHNLSLTITTAAKGGENTNHLVIIIQLVIPEPVNKVEHGLQLNARIGQVLDFPGGRVPYKHSSLFNSNANQPIAGTSKPD